MLRHATQGLTQSNRRTVRPVRWKFEVERNLVLVLLRLQVVRYLQRSIFHQTGWTPPMPVRKLLQALGKICRQILLEQHRSFVFTTRSQPRTKRLASSKVT